MGKKLKKGKERLDKFYHLAKDQGFRARSAFKLIQLAKKSDFLSKSRICIDLCAAPGGWSQVAQRNMPSGSLIIAIDLVPIKAIHGVTCIQSDITSDKCRNLLKKEMRGALADVVLHDGAPNVGTSWAKDAYSQAELVLHSLKLASEHLRPGGTFVTKVFRSSDYNSLLWVFNQLFGKVEATKPTASRNVSAEIFVLCINYKAGKIDPRFFEPKWVFMETVDAIAESGLPEKKPSAALKDHIKNQARRHRGGYEPGDDFKVMAAHDFISAENPAACLITHHKLNLEAAGSESLNEHPLTTLEIRELCSDLKVLGRKDLSLLLKWRMKILRERERAERVAQRAQQEVAAQKEPGGSASASASAVAQDVDEAIAGLLKGGPEAGGAGAAEEVDVAAEELEKELAEQIEKRRQEEKRETKRTMERQKKQEFRKKMSLVTSKDLQDQPELFRSSKKSIEALEDQDQYLDPLASDQEASEEDADEASDSDGLDRLARMEVDMAVYHELENIRKEDKCRNVMQRQRKRKKESRRQRVMAAWAGELTAFNEAIEQRAAHERMLQDQGEAAELEDEDGDGEGGSAGESDMDLEELREFQRFQASQTRALEDGEEASPGPLDGEALRALADGPPPEEAEVEAEAEAGRRRKKGSAESSQALVPLKPEEAAGEEVLRAEHRASRWFSQDIFQSAGAGSGSGLREAGANSGTEGEGSGSEGEGQEVAEVDESQLPKLPLSDKQKRKLQRRREKERRERRNQRGREGDDEDDGKPLEVAPLEPPRPLVPTAGGAGGASASASASAFQKPSDPRELAETLALGSILVESKKSRMDLIDAAYNRWAFDRNDALPVWFTEEENRFNKPELPISKELMDQFRAKLREINARPIRKVAQAKARKKRRLQKRLEKLRSTAMSLVDSPDMSEAAKARQMRKAVSRMANEDRRKVTVVAVKKGGGANRGKKERGKVPKGAKVKVVDRRMKSDLRGEKKANKRNPARQKLQARRVAKMKTRTNGKKLRPGSQDQGPKQKRRRVDGKGIFGER